MRLLASAHPTYWGKILTNKVNIAATANMTENSKKLQKITADELDAVIAHIADQGDTEFVLLRSDVRVTVEQWPARWQECAKIYQLTELVGNLCEKLVCLTNLTSLELLGNGIGKSGAKHLSVLSNLTSLNLGNNKIGDVGAKYLSVLSNLTSLVLWDNQIGDAGAKYLSVLSNLTSLDLSGNKIGDAGANHLISLANLGYLGLGRTAITNLTPFSDLRFLQSLVVTGTQVADLSPVKELIKKGIPARWDEEYSHSVGIFVKDCPLLHPSPEIMQQGPEAVLNYFQEIETQGVDKLREAKVLLVGEGRAGKTSLLRRLYQPDEPLPIEDETTKGIDIHRHDFLGDKQRTFRLNVWDFGGQQIYHATHQFFLTKNSLYILLDDTAKDHKSVTDIGFRYWLEVIDLLSYHSPVLVFQNEKGGRSKNIDKAGIKGRFPNVKDFYRGNLEQAGSSADLSKAIEYFVQQLPHVGEDVPKQWVKIRAAIEEKAKGKPYISQQDYFALYRQHLEFDRIKALHLSRYLHDLGVFLHFQDDRLLRNTVILQNRWATEAVFRILDDETVKASGGRFTTYDCERIWADSKYAHMHSELQALMEKFELCYALPDLPAEGGSTWLAPQLLAPSMPLELTDWVAPVDLVLSYRYAFLPKGLVSRLMVRKHKFVKRPEMAWDTGVLFERDGSSLLAQLASSGNEIVLRARGPEGKALLSVIAADLDALNASFTGLDEKVEKLIPCNCEQCLTSTKSELFEHRRLLKRKQDNKLTVECPGSYEMVDVLLLLDGFNLEHLSHWAEKQPPNQVPDTTTANKTIKIFLASSEELRDDRDAFDLYFRQQNDQYLKKGIYLKIIRWETSLDAVSEKGLQDKYNQVVCSSDIFVSLFMTKTGCYTEEEFDVAHKKFEQNGKPLIYTYFKETSISPVGANRNALQSLWKFQDKLKEMEHFQTEYKNIEHLKQQFRDQLDKLLDEGLI